MAWGLIFTAVHMFCWLTFEQTTRAVIEGFEQAWAYFGGIFRVVIPDYVARHIIQFLRAAERPGASSPSVVVA